MNKIKKLGIAVIALAMCLLLGVTVWAVEGEVSFKAEADKSSFCATGADQTVTVTISAGKEIDIFSLQADLVIPEGWSATVSSTSLTGTLESSNGHILWYDETAENVKATDLIVLTVTIPAAVEPDTYEIRLQNLEATKIALENDDYFEYLANGATITTEIEVKAHDWGDPTYTKDGETHTATYVCGNDANHTKTEGPTEHTYDQEDGTECVCGAVKPVTNISVVHKGNALASAYTVDGQVVTVTYSLACKVGYYDATAGKYVALTATKVADNCYSFTAPEGVTEVLLVVKGDVNGNGSVNVLDKNTLGKSILPKANANYQALNEAWQVFAADVNGNGSVNVLDKNTLGKSILPKANANYQALTW